MKYDQSQRLFFPLHDTEVGYNSSAEFIFPQFLWKL